jgi:menaquinol-cytochrome c reductase iron-sulfur subunit
MDEHRVPGRSSSGPVEPGATISSPASGDPAAEETAQARAELSRRSFVLRVLGLIGGAIAAVLGIPVVGFASAPGWQAKAPVRLLSTSIVPTLRSSALTSVGRLADFEVGVPQYIKVDRPVVDGWVAENAPVGVHVVRTSEADVAVFDPHCTHLGCPLAWSTGSRSFVCPCHGGSFNSDGDVIAGPPPGPMLRYETRIQDGEVFVGRLQEGA